MLSFWTESYTEVYAHSTQQNKKTLFLTRNRAFEALFLSQTISPVFRSFLPSLISHTYFPSFQKLRLTAVFFFLCWNLKRVTISQRKSVKTLTDRKGLFKTVFRSEILKGTLLLPMLIGGEHEFFRAAKTPCDFKVTPHFPR